MQNKESHDKVKIGLVALSVLATGAVVYALYKHFASNNK